MASPTHRLMRTQLIGTHYAVLLRWLIGWPLLPLQRHGRLTTSIHRSRRQLTPRQSCGCYDWVPLGRINWICYQGMSQGYHRSSAIIPSDLLISKNRLGFGNRLLNAQQSAPAKRAGVIIWTSVLCGHPVRTTGSQLRRLIGWSSHGMGTRHIYL